MKPLGDGFIALIKMMIAPIIFCTVVHGIASMGDLKKVGRIGIKTLIYFEVVSTLALAIGLLVGEIVQPGKGFNIDPADARSESGRRATSPAPGRRHRRPPAGDHPGQLLRRVRHVAICSRCCWSSILTGFAITRLGARRRSDRCTPSTPPAKVFFAHHRA